MGQRDQARIFISCGQNRSTGELETANAIASALKGEGFEPLVALEQQTLRGVRDNIFDELCDAEYYVFVDFKREKLDSSKEHRGSLFAHQELALASYLGKEVIAVQEEGVRRQDGLIAFLQTNCILFAERSTLPDTVLQEVRRREWSIAARNGLRLELPDPPYMDLTIENDPAKRAGRFFHIRVINNHPTRAALNCYAYIDRVEEVATGRSVEYETAELMWAGYTMPNAVIAAASSRLLAAFYVVHEAPADPQFQIFTLSGRFRPWFRGPGSWNITYRVMCESVPGTAKTYRLVLPGDYRNVALL